jgi:hypothetical protein
MLVISEANQNYQKDALSNQLTDVAGGGGRRFGVRLNLFIFERANRQVGKQAKSVSTETYKPIK